LSCSDSSEGSEYGSSNQEWLGVLEREESQSNGSVSNDEGEDEEDEDGDFFCDESEDQTQEGWCQDGSLFRQFQSEAEFLRYYGEGEWGSEHVRLLGSRNLFRGPKPRCNALSVPGKAPTLSDFWDRFWTDEMLALIVVQTNLYAKIVIRPRRNVVDDPVCCLDEENEEDCIDIEGLTDDEVQLSDNGIPAFGDHSNDYLIERLELI
jgi:hypothetical protein